MEEISSISSTRYSQLLSEVHSMTLSMGRLVEVRLRDVMQAVNQRDTRLAAKIAESDYKVNKAEMAVDEKCINLLALYNPKARDLRLIVALLKILVDIERMGDEVQRIAKNLAAMNYSQVSNEMFIELDGLGERVFVMLKEILTALDHMESEAYREVSLQDHKVDKKWNQAMEVLVSSLSHAPANVDSLLKVLWCARSLERIGDHIKNISEYIIFAAEGKDVRHPDNRSYHVS